MIKINKPTINVVLEADIKGMYIIAANIKWIYLPELSKNGNAIKVKYLQKEPDIIRVLNPSSRKYILS